MAENTFKPTLVPGLRSPYDRVGKLIYFPRMLSKIRLHAKGALPEAYHERLGGGPDGSGFDGRCVRFLGVCFEALTTATATLEGDRSDEELLEWCFQNGYRRTSEEIDVWSNFLMKRGWRDDATPLLQQRIKDAGLPSDGTILTAFDFIEIDEGRPLPYANRD
jgi:hypothetical protein